MASQSHSNSTIHLYGVRPAYFLTSKEKVGSPTYVISVSDETAIRTINNRTQGVSFQLEGVGGRGAGDKF